MTSTATAHCPDADTWYAWLGGVLDRSAARRCERHLKSCAACAEFVARSQELADLEKELRAPSDADDTESHTQRWLAQVLEALRQHQNPPC